MKRSEVFARLRDWTRRDQLDRELDEELRFHRSQLERDARAAGVEPDQAMWQARRALGNTTRVTEESRDRWSLPWLDHLQQDVRYALRGFRRSPGFAITVILTLALGIGANAAIFGVVDRLMFRPFPYLRDPGEVDRVYLKTAGWERDNTYTVFPYTRYLDLARWSSAFSQHAVFTSNIHGVGSGVAARERRVMGVSASFFQFFDARPEMGRFFGTAEDSIPTGTNVAVLGFDYWSTELGGKAVLGETIQVGNVPYTIIGVAPRGFIGVSDNEGDAPAVFVPITAYATNQGGGSRDNYFHDYNWDWAQMIVRRKRGVTREAATADLSNAFLRSWNASREVHPRYGPAEKAGLRAIAGPIKTAAGPSPKLEARTLLWVAGVAVIVLLIACANVANLLLARGMRRRREMALRLTLGVSRRRLAAQLFTETLVLSLCGSAAGVLIAAWAGLGMRRLFVGEASTFAVVGDWRTLAMAAAAAFVAALATAVLPALLAGRENLTASLKAGAREGSYQRSRARTALLVTQSALSVVLLVGAGLFVISLSKVRDLRLGYDVQPVLLVEWERRGTPMDSIDRAHLRQRLLATALARPDVERGAWTNSAPFANGTSVLNLLVVPGIDSVGKLGRFTYQIASADYFAAVDTRILRGRGFTDADRLGAPRVVVVSQAMADRLWPGGEAVGQCLRYSTHNISGDTMPCTTVVGVAENAVHDPVVDLPLRYYLPDMQLDYGATWLLLRLRRDPAAAAEDIRRELQAMMPGQALVTVRPARELFDAKRRSWRVGATLFVGLGALALIVAAVGLYGVIAYNVAQRMHELGVRIALGAQSLDILHLVMGQAARVTIAGVVTGTMLAMGVARWVQPLLFQQSATDPRVFAGVGVLLLAVAFLAAAIPAVRAMRADPNSALRSD